MSIKLLNTDKPIEFIPESEKGKAKQCKFHIKPLEWFDSFAAQSLYTQVGNPTDENFTIEIRADKRDAWNEFVAERITKIDNGGTPLPVTADTIKRLPPLIGIALFGFIFQLMQGVNPKQSKK